MSPKKAAKRPGGAPQKVPGGFDRALYVRMNQPLSEQLEKLTEARSEAAGVVLSKADVARGLIQKAMGDHMRDEERNEKLAQMDDTCRIEEGWSQGIMRDHITDYFLASEEKRVEVSSTLEEATRENCDIYTAAIPCGQWRHKWPPGLRKAILAMWRTPKDE